MSSPASTALGVLRRAARSHPGLLVSVAYLTATAIGMLSSWTLHARFGVNVFHYAQLQDFVVAAIRTPAASLAILLALPVVWVVVRYDNLLFERFRWYRILYGPKPLQRLSRSAWSWGLYLVAYAFFFSVLYSTRTERRIRAGDAPRAAVQLQSGSYRDVAATEPFTAHLLSTTSGYVLLYDVVDEAVTVVPVENVVSLTYLPE